MSDVEMIFYLVGLKILTNLEPLSKNKIFFSLESDKV